MPVLGNVLLEVDGPADALAAMPAALPVSCVAGARRARPVRSELLCRSERCRSAKPALRVCSAARGAAAREAGAPSSARPARGAVASETMEVIPCAPRLGRGALLPWVEDLSVRLRPKTHAMSICA